MQNLSWGLTNIKDQDIGKWPRPVQAIVTRLTPKSDQHLTS